jgi:dynein assembly factor 1, axonemal
LIEKNRLG